MAAGANAAFVHYSAFLSGAGATTLRTVPANKVLLASKIIVANVHATVSSTILVSVGGSAIIQNLTLAPGESWTETGVVAPAAEVISATPGTTGVLAVHVFGEEVDAS